MYIVNGITPSVGVTIQRSDARFNNCDKKEKSCKDCCNYNKNTRVCKANKVVLTVFTLAKNCNKFSKEPVSFEDFLKRSGI